CWEVRKHNSSEWCHFIRSNPDCRLDGGFLDYLDGVFCVFPPRLLPLAVTLYALWLLYLFIILGVTAEKFFCPNLSAISTNLKLSHNVAVFSLTCPLHGVTFLAFGNGAPDVFSAVVAFSDPRTAGLAIGAIFGAGVFVTTVVAGGIALGKPFTAASRPFLRDVIFYMVAVFLTFVVLYLGRIRLGEALGERWGSWGPVLEGLGGTGSPTCSVPVALTGEEYRPLLPSGESSLRILSVALSPLDCRKWRRKPWYWRLFKALKVPVELVLLLTVPVVDPDKDDLNWKRPLNCLHILTSPLLCVLTLKSGAYGLYQIQGIFPVWGVVTLVASALALIIFITTSNEEPPKYHCVRCPPALSTHQGPAQPAPDWAEGPWAEQEAGPLSQFPVSPAGMPGGVQGPVGCTQTSLLLLLSGVCLPWLEPDSPLVWVLAGALGLSLVFSFVTVPAQCFQLGQAYGICLIAYYLVFLCVALLTEFRVIHFPTP
ncbi:NCLX protein, partial [Chloropsis hardwickii]|nr:NCLX protein [Chloropsis hardwickii]